MRKNMLLIMHSIGACPFCGEDVEVYYDLKETDYKYLYECQNDRCGRRARGKTITEAWQNFNIINVP